jgi:CRP-like cAMP-binding protein
MRAAAAGTGHEPASPKRRARQDPVERMLAVVPWYNGQPQLEREVVRAELRVVSLQAGERLFREGSKSLGWYGVVDGLVKWSSRGSDGKSLSLAGFSTGSWFGEATMIRREPFEYEVVALRPS